jgi:hypothetical protein
LSHSATLFCVGYFWERVSRTIFMAVLEPQSWLLTPRREDYRHEPLVLGLQ